MEPHCEFQVDEIRHVTLQPANSCCARLGEIRIPSMVLLPYRFDSCQSRAIIGEKPKEVEYLLRTLLTKGWRLGHNWRLRFSIFPFLAFFSYVVKQHCTYNRDQTAEDHVKILLNGPHPRGDRRCRGQGRGCPCCNGIPSSANSLLYGDFEVPSVVQRGSHIVLRKLFCAWGFY